jgi:PKD repeat protein
MQTFYSKLKLTLLTLTFASAYLLNAQTVIYSENFNGASHTWTLNTTEVQSVVGQSNASPNFWIVNNIYNGGPGSFTCLGLIAADYSFASTPTQPPNILGNPTSNYLHITAIGGPMNAGYLGPDGLCVTAQNHFTRMTNDVNTLGYDEVEFKFWWMGTGASNSYMQLFYSTNSGTNWTQVNMGAPNFFIQNSVWKEETVSIPDFGNKATLRFGFRLMNGANNTFFPGPSIGYSIDDIQIIGLSGSVPNQIATGTISPLSYCTEQSVSVPFTVQGTYNAGNVFTAQLSNATGSFAAPVNIGTLSSTASGTINATIPAGTPNGTGYRIRVVSSNPVTNGTENTSNITITQGQASTINVTPPSPVSFCTGLSATLTAEAGYTNYVWTPSGTGQSITVNTAGTYTVTADAPGGCGTASSGPIEVSIIDVPVANFTYQQQPGGYIIVFSNTSQDGATFLWNFGGGNSSTQANPTFEFPFEGTYPITLTVTNDCGTNSITIGVIVQKDFVGINDLDTDLANIEMYPNPALNFTILKGESSKLNNYNLNIVNVLGQSVYNENFTVNGTWTKNIDASPFSKGIYWVVIRSDKGTSSKKLIIQ